MNKSSKEKPNQIVKLLNTLFCLLFYFFLYKFIFSDNRTPEFKLIFQKPSLKSIRDFFVTDEGIYYVLCFFSSFIGSSIYSRFKEK